MDYCITKMEIESPDNNCNTNGRKAGRPALDVESITVTFRLRRERSQAEDMLMDRLAKLTERRQRSRFIRRVLTTGEIDLVLDREFARETERVGSALDALATYFDDDDGEEDDF